MAVVSKNSKNNKINFYAAERPEPLGIIAYKFSWTIIATLVFKLVKIEKKSTAELGRSDLLSVNTSNFAQMLISQENINIFWSDLTIIVP